MPLFTFPALINNAQKDLLSREKETLKLAAEVDNLRKDLRHKDAQLSNMANKVQLCPLLASGIRFQDLFLSVSSLIAVKDERA